MDNAGQDDLSRHVGECARIECSDGEIIEAKVIAVGVDENDIIVDILSSNKPERYALGNASYSISLNDIRSFEPL